MTRDQIEAEITACKNLLSQTDYVAIKHADGVLSAEDYEPTRLKRDGWRKSINDLEKQLENMPEKAAV